MVAEAKSKEEVNKQLPEESMFSRLPFEAEVWLLVVSARPGTERNDKRNYGDIYYYVIVLTK